jgi:hypothetical protein
MALVLSSMTGRLIVTGGEQRDIAAWLKASERYKRSVHRKAILVEVDPRTRGITTLVEHVTQPALRAGRLSSILFKSAALEADRLYLTTMTEVLILSWPDLRLVRHLSHPCFGDVHHARPTPTGDGVLVACSGLDMVVAFDAGDEPVEFLPVLDEAPWSRYSPETDYRKALPTAPREAHPNFIFHIDGELWVTRSAQKDAVCLHDRSKRIDIGIERVHDGFVVGDLVYFTTVNGYVVVADARTRRVEARIDLFSLSGKEAPLGWCRGIHVTGDIAYVGFSRIRPTRLYENVRWVRSQVRPGTAAAPARPTRIGVYDLARGSLLDEVDLEQGGLAAVYSIIEPPDPLPPAATVPAHLHSAGV